MGKTEELLATLNQIDASKPVYQGEQASGVANAYQQQLGQMEANKPSAYQSKYQSTITNLMNQISNRKPFSYDFNADPLYQQYKDSYTKLGKEASMNAVTNASNMSGGYANSYATTAANQANQQYLTQLNNVIPELYNAALQKYDKETENLYKQFSMYGEQEDRNYGRYQDKVSDYKDERSYLADRLQNERSNEQWNNTFNYNKYRDAVSDWESSRNYYNDRYNNSVSQDQWNAQMAYQKERDAISDAQKAVSSSRKSSGSSNKNSTVTLSSSLIKTFDKVQGTRTATADMNRVKVLNNLLKNKQISEAEAAAIVNKYNLKL